MKVEREIRGSEGRRRNYEKGGKANYRKGEKVGEGNEIRGRKRKWDKVEKRRGSLEELGSDGE